MSHAYGDQIAKHYSAYRPDLHGLILRRLIRSGEHFKIGLDIGCGTGYSAVALSEHCDQVFGLEPSQSMINEATPHPKISYVQGSGDDLSVVPQNAFSVVTFAGSLSYTKTDELKRELLRTLPSNGVVLVYDFQVLLNDLAAQMDVRCNPTPSDYNFTINLSDWPEFASEGTTTDRVKLNVSAQEASHLLLANSYRYPAFQERFSTPDPFDQLTKHILKQNEKAILDAEIYFSRHPLS